MELQKKAAGILLMVALANSQYYSQYPYPYQAYQYPYPYHQQVKTLLITAQFENDQFEKLFRTFIKGVTKSTQTRILDINSTQLKS